MLGQISVVSPRISSLPINSLASLTVTLGQPYSFRNTSRPKCGLQLYSRAHPFIEKVWHSWYSVKSRLAEEWFDAKPCFSFHPLPNFCMSGRSAFAEFLHTKVYDPRFGARKYHLCDNNIPGCVNSLVLHCALGGWNQCWTTKL